MNTNSNPNTVYFAKHILLESGEILLNGAISVCGGVITGVGPRGTVRRSSDERVVNLGDMLLLPGFINMHTHLEESLIRGFEKEPGESFAAWSVKKYARMRQLNAELLHDSIKLNAREMISQGITTVVDSTRTGISAPALSLEPIRSVIIMEVADEEFVEEGLWRLQLWSDSGFAFKYGLGPHAFYSLEPRWQKRLIQYSYDSGCLWATHAAESAEELQAFCEHSGDFYFNQTRKKPWPAGDRRLDPIQYAFAEGLIPSHAILFHCNYATSAELGLLAAKHAFVTICLRYGEEMEHKSFPIEAACKRGIRICLGTEGMVAPGKANLFDDLFRLKMEYPHISAGEMLQWVTKNPAAALKAADKLGSIAAGKLADVIGVRFCYDGSGRDGDILEALLVSDPEIAFVMIDGEEVIIDR